MKFILGFLMFLFFAVCTSPVWFPIGLFLYLLITIK